MSGVLVFSHVSGGLVFSHISSRILSVFGKGLEIVNTKMQLAISLNSCLEGQKGPRQSLCLTHADRLRVGWLNGFSWEGYHEMLKGHLTRVI
jgi:hypothetical protein